MGCSCSASHFHFGCQEFVVHLFGVDDDAVAGVDVLSGDHVFAAHPHGLGIGQDGDGLAILRILYVDGSRRDGSDRAHDVFHAVVGEGRDAEDESEWGSKQAFHEWFVSFPNYFQVTAQWENRSENPVPVSLLVTHPGSWDSCRSSPRPLLA